MQFAQCRVAVDPGEPAAFVDNLARHHDQVDTVAIRQLDDGVENRGLRVELGVDELVPVSKPTAAADKSAHLSISTSRNVVGLAGMSGERGGCERQVEAVTSRSSRERRGLAVGAAVEAALRQERLLFAFQPVVCAATGKVDYFECLLRMRDEKGGIVSGGEFITVVEELGWIGLIDRYVLKKTVQALAAEEAPRSTAIRRTPLRN